MGLLHRGVQVISCPSCARQGFNVIETVSTLEDRLAHISTPISLSIIGCVVNGPGAALMTDIGLTGGGNGHREIDVAGKPDHNIHSGQKVEHLVALVEKRLAELREGELAAAPR